MPIPPADLFLPPLIDRGVLLVNHVLRAQPTATERLVRHAGRSVAIDWRAAGSGWPAPPSFLLQVTPAGLLERIGIAELGGDADAVALRVCIELPAPHRLIAMALARERPRVDVDGDAQFAADVAWLADHLHWDVEHDLARVVGDMPARFLCQAAQAGSQAVRSLAASIGDAWERRPGRFERRPGAGAASPQ